MFRNQYDTDVTTFSPAGKIHQVAYAIEAVKQGSAAVGLRSKDVAVVASIKRSPSELASYQKKMYKIDEHMGIAISGLIADARVLCRFMRNECLNHRYVYESAMQVSRLVGIVSDKSQVYTQKAEKRPYGVGLLVIGYDKTGAHLFQTLPSGNHFEYVAQAMGARSQSAKTYLERHFESFDNASKDDLIRHAVNALKGTLQSGKITTANCSIAFVGRDMSFTILDGDAVRPYIQHLDADDDAAAAAAAAPAADDRKDAQASHDDDTMQVS